MPSSSASSVDRPLPEVEFGASVNTGDVAEAMVSRSDVVCSTVLLFILIASLQADVWLDADIPGLYVVSS